MKEPEHLNPIQIQINQVLGVDSALKRRKRKTEDYQRDLFIKTIPLIEHINDRGLILASDFGMDMSTYDEIFNKIIDNLIYLNFGKQVGDLIMFFIYDRLDGEGNVVPIKDSNGMDVYINSVEDLWEIVKVNKK